jgi:uncharacterized protein (TIGR00251 family)
MAWVQDIPGGVRLSVRVVLRARKTAFGGIHRDLLKIALQAPAVDGKANRALVQHLSHVLGVESGSIHIPSGVRTRNKSVVIAGISADWIRSTIPVDQPAS